MYIYCCLKERNDVLFWGQNIYIPHESLNFERFWKALSVIMLFRYF